MTHFKVLILAAGQGTRLRPLTDEIPKCMVAIGGKTIMERQLENFRIYDPSLSNIAIVGGYKIEKLPKLKNVFENTRYLNTNMVSSLFSATQFFDDKMNLIISYGDIVYDESALRSLVCSDTSNDINLVSYQNWFDLWKLRMEDPLDDVETFTVEDGIVKELGKKTNNIDEVQGQFTGLFMISKQKISDMVKFYEMLDRGGCYDGQNFDNMYMTTFIQLLINHGWKVGCVPIMNGWVEIDSVNDLQAYEGSLAENKLTQFIQIS